MHCPKCSQPLEAFYEGLYEDILCHRCPACDALWIPPDSLGRLDDNVSVDASRIEWTERDADHGRPCPACVGRYRTQGPQLRFVEIPSDNKINAYRCTECRGFLLTADTLERIRVLVRGRGAPNA